MNLAFEIWMAFSKKYLSHFYIKLEMFNSNTLILIHTMGMLFNIKETNKKMQVFS